MSTIDCLFTGFIVLLLTICHCQAKSGFSTFLRSEASLNAAQVTPFIHHGAATIIAVSTSAEESSECALVLQRSFFSKNSAPMYDGYLDLFKTTTSLELVNTNGFLYNVN